MAKQQVTVQIDDSSISILVSKGTQLQKWAHVPLDEGLVKEGVVQDQVSVAAKLKEAWSGSRILRRKVTVGISGVNCLYQLLLLPELPENLRGEAISREAATSLGIPLEGVYLSWQVLTSEHGQMKVYLAVLPRDKVDSVVATLKMADLRPVGMDIKPLCLARASNQPRALIVDVCQDAFDIVVLADGIPEVVRSLYVMRDTGPGERMALLRSELERSISFYNAAHMDNPIDLTVPVLVTGDIMGQDSEKAALAGPRERPVFDMESPMGTVEGFNPGKYMACMGLALKEVLLTEPGAVANSLVNFNALPEIYQIRKRPLSEILWLPTVLVGVVIIAMGTWGIMDLKSENSSLETQRDSINRQMQTQGVRDADITALKTKVTTAEEPPAALEKLLGQLATDRAGVTEDLRVIRENESASGVILSSVKLDSDTVTISGFADTEEELFDFGWRMKDSGRFSTVMILSIGASGDEVSFSMKLE